MSYVGGKLYYGFELSEKYIEGLLEDMPEDEWGYEPSTHRNCNEIYEKLGELLGDGLSVEVCSHGTQDGHTFYIYTDSHHAHAGESKQINLADPSKKELKNLWEAIEKLKAKVEDDDIGWHLAAFWD